MNKDDGGFAFPRTETPHSVPQDGMTLRQWYAGQAIAGILNGGGEVGQRAQENPAMAAAWTFEIADAMLEHERAERRNREGGEG